MLTLLSILGAPVHLSGGELIIITLLEQHRWKYTWAFSKLTKHEAAKQKK